MEQAGQVQGRFGTTPVLRRHIGTVCRDDPFSLPFCRRTRCRQAAGLFRTDGNQMDIIPPEQLLHLRLHLHLTIIAAVLAKQAGAD